METQAIMVLAAVAAAVGLLIYIKSKKGKKNSKNDGTRFMKDLGVITTPPEVEVENGKVIPEPVEEVVVSDDEAFATLESDYVIDVPVPLPKPVPTLPVTPVQEVIRKVRLDDKTPIFRNLFFQIRLLKGNQLYKMEDKPFTAWIERTDKFDRGSLYLLNTEGDVLQSCSVDPTIAKSPKITYTTDMSSGPCYIFTTSDTGAMNALVLPTK